MATKFRTWTWRKAEGGWKLDTDPADGRLFHAYDVNDNAACEPSMGLAGTVETPTEGSELCVACVDIVRANPAGRDARVETA